MAIDPTKIDPKTHRTALREIVDFLADTFDANGLLDRIVDSAAAVTLQVKVVEINDWNMDGTTTVTVAHGLTLANIRAVLAMIRDDADANYYQMGGFTLAGSTTDNEQRIGAIDATNVSLSRRQGGTFDSTDFNATSYNRGWLLIWHAA